MVVRVVVVVVSRAPLTLISIPILSFCSTVLFIISVIFVFFGRQAALRLLNSTAVEFW